MQLKQNDLDAANVIDLWYKSRCNGTWEHKRPAVTIEATDNPGWLVTINDLRLDKELLAKALGSLLTDYDAQVGTDNRMVRVFSSSLSDCLNAAATLIGKAEKKNQ